MFITVPLRRFTGPKAADDLSIYLRQTKETTVIRKIENERMVQLSPNGLLANRFRLTRTAAREFGSRLAKHFGTALLDLGEHAAAVEEVETLVSAVNQLVSIRFGAFDGWKWVIDTKDNLAVGLLGPRYRVTYNSDFWEGIRRTSLSQTDKPRLFTALVMNRNLDVVMAGGDRVSVGPATFARGVLAQNAETSGRAVRAANVLISTSDYMWACDNFYADTRIPHLKGRKFDAKMTQIYDRLRQRRIPVEELRSAWTESAAKRLSNPKLTLDENIDKLATFLRGKGLIGGDAIGVARELLVVNKAATVVDLFRLLSRRATGRSDISAIRCRQIAYQMCFQRK